MKRVFAFLSLFAIALVMFGFGTNVKAADEPAEGKWFENPFLLKNDNGDVVEIPMYIMNSIKTTFPDYFDYEGAKGTEFEDKNWGGTVRQYAWNGVKVVIPEFVDGEATGQSFGIYPQGASKGGQIGIGGMIYTTKGTYDKGAFYDGKKTASYIRTSPADPSLSFYMINEEDYAWNLEDKGINAASAANPYLLFDANGKAVGGYMLPDTSSGAMEDSNVVAQFCWDANGVGIVAGDESNCAKVMVDGEEDDLNNPILDEDGNQVTDENGNPLYNKVQVPGPDTNYVTDRFIWAYMDEAPANLNNSYLGEGWKADNWDFYNEETKVAVTFLDSYFANGGAVTDAEVKADGTIQAGHIRAPFKEMAIPAGGLLYKFGYLERTSTLLPLFKQVQAQAYLYGREEGYAQTFKCYNYASSDIKFQNTVNNGLGLTLLNGDTVEVVAGEVIDFDKLINLTGVTYSFADETNPLTFQSAIMDAEALAAKKQEFIEAEKAIMREEVAYEVYQKWLDEQAAEIAKLQAAVDAAQTKLDNALATQEALEKAAEAEILASEDATVVDAYKAKQQAIELAKAAITDKEAEIVKKQDAVDLAKQAYEASQVSHRDTIQYKGYNSSLTDAKAAHDAALAIVRSYVALGLGNENITTADVTVEATQDSVYEDWKIVFGGAALEAAENAFVEAIHTGDATAITDARAALLAAFCVEADDTFSDKYEAVVNTYIDTLVKLDIANTAMHDYIADCLAKTQDKAAALAAAEAALATAKAELGAPSVEDDPATSANEKADATGLYKVLEDAEQARKDYIAYYLANNQDYLNACTAVTNAQAELNAAKAALGTPSTDETSASGYYATYEATVKEVEDKITEEATKRAEVVYQNWLVTEYRDEVSLSYTIYVDDERVVAKAEYANHDAVREALMADLNAFAGTNYVLPAKGTAFEGTGAGTFYGTFNSEVLGYCQFLKDETYGAKWRWLFEYISTASGNAGGTTIDWSNMSAGSPGNWTTTVYCFLNATGPKTGWPTNKVDFSGEIGLTGWMPISYEDYELVAHEKVNGVKHVKVEVYNPILDYTSTLELDFVSVIDAYDVTPVIQVNKDALYVTDPKSFNVRDIANAYDKVWDEVVGFNGNDISDQLDFICPELDAALATGTICGEFPVEMSVRNLNGRKVVTETAVVKFVDNIAPVLQARDVTLNYGEDFHFLDGIYFAYDNVEGNLFDANYSAFVAEEDTVNTSEPGEYTVVVSAMDRSGNSAEVEYVVYVNDKVTDELEGKLDSVVEELDGAIKDNNDALKEDIAKENEELAGTVNGVQDKLEDVEAAANDKSLVVVATVLAGVAAVASIGAVVLVILKKN